MSEKSSIEKPHYLIVEGKDDLIFFNAFLEYHQLDSQIGVYAGGKDGSGENGGYTKLGKAAATLKKLDFQNLLQSLILVRDVDDNLEASFKDVCERLNAEGLAYPPMPQQGIGHHPTIYVLMMPMDGAGRMLEDMLFASVANTPAGQCVETYLDCLSQANIRLNPMLFPKRKSSLYQMTFHDADNKNPPLHEVWNFDSPAFSALTTFLTQLTA